MRDAPVDTSTPPAATGDAPSPVQKALLHVHDLHLPLDEAEDVLAAIRTGEVDALVVSVTNRPPSVFLLEGADDPYRVLLETLNEGAMTVAQDATILYANRRVAELLARPPGQVLGARLTAFLVHADAAALREMLAEKPASAKREMALLTREGVVVPVMVSMRVVRGDPSGDPDAFSIVLTDLSPLKAAAIALRRANDELEARVIARTEEIARVNDALRAQIAEGVRLAAELAVADVRKNEFLSMLAHELRNPLSPILTSAEMLRFAAGRDQTVERCRAVIERQAKHLSHLVDDLLDLSQITREVIPLRIQDTDVGILVDSVVSAAGPLIVAAGHELTVSLPEGLPLLRADPTRLEQVLMNVLANAAKYTDRGGSIHLSAELSGDEVILRVKDSGIGIAPDLLPHVFELFVQGKRPLARSQGGLGIGLTVVKKLVDMHGGKVELRSEGLGCGSEVVIHLPVVARPAAVRSSFPAIRVPAPPPAESPPPPSAPASRVLVVEDNEDSGEMLVALLEHWGFDVRLVTNGEDALVAVADYRPHVALIDVGLPGLDGLEVARRLRLTETPDCAPVLIGLTGYGQQRDRERGAEAGFHHYLVKPLRTEMLKQIFEDASILPRSA